MKPKLIGWMILALSCVLWTGSYSQVGVGTTTPESSSLLDVSSTSKGLLVPRMTSAQRAAIVSPASGLIVFQTDAPSGFYFYQGTGWRLIEQWKEGGGGHVIDADGNVYPTVKIGTQEWMAESLRVTHYQNGDSIPNITDGTWSGLTTGAWRRYGDTLSSVANYGLIYNWFAVDDSRHLCPVGWHVPARTEWDILVTYLGGSALAGGTMKAAGKWDSPNTGATNSSGFSALGGGYCAGSSGAFNQFGNYGNFWTATASSPAYAYYRQMLNTSAVINDNGGSKNFGIYVRCMKD